MSLKEIQEFPRNGAYSHIHKSAFQDATKSAEVKQIVSLSGTSIQEVSSSSHKSHRTRQIQQLYKRIDHLQHQLQQVTDLLVEEETSRSQAVQELERANSKLQQRLQKSAKMNEELEKQLEMSEDNNEKLNSALEDMSDQIQELKTQMRRHENVSESKSSQKTTKTNKELQDDIVHLNEEIEKILDKFHLLGEDFSQVQTSNDALKQEREHLKARIQQLEDKLKEGSQPQGRDKRTEIAELRRTNEMATDEIQMLKEEIEKFSELSIMGQRNIQDEYFAKQNKLYEEIASLTSEVETLRRQPLKGPQTAKAEEELKQTRNSLIKAKAENDKLRCHIDQVSRHNSTAIEENYKEREKILIRDYEEKMRNLEEFINISKEEEKISKLEIDRLGSKKEKLSEEVQSLKVQLRQLEKQTGDTQSVKIRYQGELQGIRHKIEQVQRIADERAARIAEEHQRHQSQASKIMLLNQKNEELESHKRQLENLLLVEKEEKNKQNNRYKQLLSDYKEVNQDITEELNQLRSLEHGKCPLKNPQFLSEGSFRAEGQMRMKLNNLEKQQKMNDFVRVDNASLKSKTFNLERANEDLKKSISKMEEEAEYRRKEYEKWKQAIEAKFEGKLELQKMEIINEYNVLLRDRGVKIEENNRRAAAETVNSYSLTASFGEERKQTCYAMHSVSMHPQYKKVQEELLGLNRQFLQMQHNHQKSTTEMMDEIERLKIENKYHRTTIDQLHAEGYGMASSSGQELEQLRNRNQELNQQYQKLYQEFVQVKQTNEHRMGRMGVTSSWHGVGLLEAKVNARDNIAETQRSHTNWNPHNIEPMHRDVELSELKRVVNEKMELFEVTPRESTSVMERTIWMIEKVAAMVVQLREDQEVLRRQKKESQKECDKLAVRVETAEYEKNHLLKELAVVAEKLRYMEDRNYRMALGSNPQTYSEVDPKGRLQEDKNEISSRNSVERDVHLHEAGLIREQRLTLLRKYQQQISSVGSRTH